MADPALQRSSAFPIRLTIVTPIGKALDREVDTVTAPGVWGEFEVLPGHTQYLTELSEGEVAFTAGSEKGHFAVLGGFAEVGPDHVSILAEGAQESGEIDLAKTISQKEKYEKLLMEIGPLDPRYDDTRKAIKNLVALLTVAQRHK
jgi:F-type H+-transporting ATPase subunit epsilon